MENFNNQDKELNKLGEEDASKISGGLAMRGGLFGNKTSFVCNYCNQKRDEKDIVEVPSGLKDHDHICSRCLLTVKLSDGIKKVLKDEGKI